MKELKHEDFFTYNRKEDDESESKSITYWKNVRVKFFKNKVAVTCLLVILIVIILSIIGPMITKYSYFQHDYKSKNLCVSKEHYFGTTDDGRDIFSGVWIGARTTLSVGIIAGMINVIIGAVMAVICAYYGGIVDDIINRIVEILMSIPNLLIIILVIIVLPQSMYSFIIAFTVAGWCNGFMSARGQLIQIKNQEYVLAAQALGSSGSRILGKYYLRNVITTAVITITIEIPNIMCNEMLMTYLGMIKVADLSWGSLLNESQFKIMFYPYQFFIPAGVVAITLISFNLLGDGLRDALDVKDATY